jgi:hypothetical protein
LANRLKRFPRVRRDAPRDGLQQGAGAARDPHILVFDRTGKVI